MFTQAHRRIDGSVVVLKAKYMPIVKLFKKLLAVASLIPCVVVAQGYPNRPITVVVPYPPGGAVDPLARIFTTKLAEIWKVPIIIDNRPGAGTMIGMGYVAKAAPDGYTVAMGTTSVGTNPAMYEKMPFDTLKDFTFLSQAGIFQLALSVHPSIPVSTIAELIAYAKKNPGKLNYSSAGNGTIAHLAGEYFKSEAGFEATHVPYKGSSAAVTAVASAEVSFTIDTVFTETPMIKAGLIKPLATIGPKRLESTPQLPTIAETFPGFTAFSWMGFMGPAGVPADIVKKWAIEITRIAEMQDVKEKLGNLGAEPVGGSAEQFEAFAKAELIKWNKVVTDAKIEKVK
jgi:tripartite-type tricarboxylate transporter receptor subunit TctC